MIQKIKAATGDKIHIALDTVSEKETQFTAIKALAEGAPGRLLVILPLAEGISDVRKDVEVGCSSTFPYLSQSRTRVIIYLFAVTIIFSAYGFDFRSFGLNDDNRRELSAFLQEVPGLVKDRKLKPTPIRWFEGGLAKVYSDGYKYFAEGKVSAERVVFTL
jgi:hypothetical protein